MKSDFLVGGGEMGRLVQSMDWSASPLGPLESWPQSLRTTVGLCLASNFPIALAWGPDRVQIYNDGYRPICGGKHPTSMGQDFKECWASAWPVIGAAFEGGLRGEACYIENQRMFLDRNGYLEEAFFTFSFSPIRDESGAVGGLFHPLTEQTTKMLSERRTRALRDLSAYTVKAKTTADVFALAAECLAREDFDVPFALFYVLDADGAHASLAARAGLAPGTAASPDQVELVSRAPWPLGDVVRSGGSLQIDDLGPLLGTLSCGPYENAPDTALMFPIPSPGSERPMAVVIMGVSSRLRLDAAYRDFFDLVASAVTAAAASARAYEGERQRAETLAALDRAKTAFFSNVSHEFRTPLTLMLGPIEDALGDAGAALPPAQRERLEVALRNALRLLKLVNTLLDFSRIEAGRARASFAPTDLATLTAELASNFRSVCEAGGVALIVDCPPLGEPVHVDREMWEKIVINLISNAFKFTLRGEIAVGLRRGVDGWAELSVRDTGVGIPEKELPRVFERFHRVEGSLGRSVEGSGIGLALVQELVRLHGGEIGVESEIGVGSTFRARIPLGEAHLPKDRPQAATAASPAARSDAFIEEMRRWIPNQPSGRPSQDVSDAGADRAPANVDAGERSGGRIVLADDNADMRGYVQRLLTSAGYRVDAFANGAEALAACLASAPELLVTDIMMPEMDGFAVLRRLRANLDTETVPVILLSARAGEEARIEGLAAGADDYIVKPFGGRELLARVGAAISLFRLRRLASAREQDLLEEIAAARSRVSLLESETRVQVALEAGRLGAWELDVASDVARSTRLHDKIFGYDEPSPAWGFRHFMRHVIEEDRQRVEAAFRTAVAAKTQWEIECRITRADGRARWIAIFGRPIRGEDGEVAQIFGIVSDVTERKQTEAALLQAQKLEAVGRLAAGVAHDFNNLLQSIMGALELVLDGVPVKTEAHDFADLAFKSAQRGASLTRHLLSYARKQILMPRSIDLSTFLSELKPLMIRSLGAHIAIEARADPGTPPVFADQGQLQTALLNLAINASHAMPSGGQLSMTARAASDEGGDWVALSVSDTGTGMDEATLARAVDPFFTTKGLDGSGLGLSMVSGFAEQSHGHMRIVSKLGVGTTVELRLPVAQAEAEALAIPHAPAASGRVLLVDDAADVLVTTGAFLSKAGFEVVQARNGDEALSILAKGERFDAMVTDFAMPGMNGVDLIAESRQIWPDLPALIITGFAEAKGREALPDDVPVLQKPLTRLELIQTLQRVARAVADRRGPAEFRG